MREIKYLGNFKEDIENVRKPVSFREKMSYVLKKYRMFFVLLLLSVFVVLGVVNVNNILMGNLILPSIMQLIGMTGISVVTILNLKNIRSIKQSEKELFNLRRDLSRDCGISVSKKGIQNSRIIKQEEKSLYSYKGNREFIGVKVIRYFELLDRNEQIQVLKQVQNILLNSDLNLNSEYQLFLLEDGDLELDDIKKKRLVP